MKIRKWIAGDGIATYLYHDETGRIVGECGRAGNTINTKHYATVYPNNVDILNLGMYINTESAKAAVELYWNIQEQTFLEGYKYDTTSTN